MFLDTILIHMFSIYQILLNKNYWYCLKKKFFIVCREAMEVLTVSMVLNPSAHGALICESFWSEFITNLVLVSESKQVRQTAAEQLLLITTWCSTDRQPLEFITSLLVSVLNTLALKYAYQSQEYFMVIFRTMLSLITTSITRRLRNIIFVVMNWLVFTNYK